MGLGGDYSPFLTTKSLKPWSILFCRVRGSLQDSFKGWDYSPVIGGISPPMGFLGFPPFVLGVRGPFRGGGPVVVRFGPFWGDRGIFWGGGGLLGPVPLTLGFPPGGALRPFVRWAHIDPL